MAATPPTRKMHDFTVPRRDGRVKAQIFESLTGSVSSVASKALAKFKQSSSAPPSALNSETTSAATSTTTTPPQSAYTSDGYTDHA